MKTILIMIFCLFGTSVFAEEVPAWTRNPERSEDKFAITHTVTGYGHNKVAAILVAKGIFLEKILKECNSLHKAAVVTHTYARKVGNQYIAHASGMIAKRVCAYSKKLPKYYREVVDSKDNRETFLNFNLYFTMLKMGLRICDTAKQCYDRGIKESYDNKFYRAINYFDEGCAKGHRDSCRVIKEMRQIARDNYY